MTSLNTFVEKSMNQLNLPFEDAASLKKAFEESSIGEKLKPITGAGGGVVFTPSISKEESLQIAETLHESDG